MLGGLSGEASVGPGGCPAVKASPGVWSEEPALPSRQLVQGAEVRVRGRATEERPGLGVQQERGHCWEPGPGKSAQVPDAVHSSQRASAREAQGKTAESDWTPIL